MENNMYNNSENLQVITENKQTITPQDPSPKKTKGTAAKAVALALCCSLVGGIAGAGGILCYESFHNTGTAETVKTQQTSTILTGQRDNTSVQLTSVDTSKEMTDAENYAANVNSTVGISSTVTANYYGQKIQGQAAGSGFILTSDGYIVTNYHVVDGASDIKVTTYDNKTYDAKLIGYDESNDVAVLKVDANDLTPVVLGDSDQMNVGDNVVAIGNPLGELSFSLTSGSISALNRKVTISDSLMNLIQTDCTINSGNSGGALFNSHGEVIGITNAKYSNNGDSSSASIENIGFAIPINSVRDIITSIIENGYIEKPYIGVTVSNLSGIYQNTDLQGAAVQSVEKGSPAEEAGLRSGDIITEVNGEKITGTSELISLLSQGKKGDRYTLTVIRDGETISIKVSLGIRQQDALPDEEETVSQDQSQNGQGFPYSGGNGQDFPYSGDNGQGNPYSGDNGQGYPGYPGQGFDGQSPFGDSQDSAGGSQSPFGDGRSSSDSSDYPQYEKPESGN